MVSEDLGGKKQTIGNDDAARHRAKLKSTETDQRGNGERERDRKPLPTMMSPPAGLVDRVNEQMDQWQPSEKVLSDS